MEQKGFLSPHPIAKARGLPLTSLCQGTVGGDIARQDKPDRR